MNSMSPVWRLVMCVALSLAASASARAQEPPRLEFAPPQGRGPVVVVVSGASGPQLYQGLASRLAAQGYFAVLIDGNRLHQRVPAPGFDGAAALRRVIAEAVAAPQALPGKVALLGFSLGGAAVLLHGAPLHEQVAAVVAYYPAITPLGPDLRPLAAGLQVPVLLIAGEQDRYADCCLIESMRALAAAPKTAPFELVSYPAASHGFNLEETQFAYLATEAADAWARTTAFLASRLPRNAAP